MKVAGPDVEGTDDIVDGGTVGMTGKAVGTTGLLFSSFAFDGDTLLELSLLTKVIVQNQHKKQLQMMNQHRMTYMKLGV